MEIATGQAPIKAPFRGFCYLELLYPLFVRALGTFGARFNGMRPTRAKEHT